ncbi:AI-2E family transporter [Rhodopirellula sp. JC740]|uniref:AI-2E family transporter n=1 Tax=Rhodopirellula halodulae TaxID=2894198 RepID=A0ABS8NCI3_9BACT|nr:AI-2E family transporter [Rhodopirellula sp. JC740]
MGRRKKTSSNRSRTNSTHERAGDPSATPNHDAKEGEHPSSATGEHSKSSSPSQPLTDNQPETAADGERDIEPGKAAPKVSAKVSDSGEGRKQILFPQLPSLSRIMSVVMLVIGILAVGVLFYRLMIGFFVPLFLAALLVVIFRPIHLWILQKTGQRKRVAAGTTTALILFIVLLPLGVLVSVATTQFTILLSKMNLSNMSVAMERVRSQVGLSLPHPEHFRELDRIVGDITVPKADDPLAVQNKITELRQAAAIIQYLQTEVPNADMATGASEIAIENLNEYADLLRASIDEEPATSFLPSPNNSTAPATSSLGGFEDDEFSDDFDALVPDSDKRSTADEPPRRPVEPSFANARAAEDEATLSATTSLDQLGPSTDTDLPLEPDANAGDTPSDSAGRDEPRLLVQLNKNERFERPAVITAASVRSWMNLLLGGSLRSQLSLLANPDEEDFSSLIRMARESLQPRFVRLTSATGSIVAQVIFGLVILVVAVYFFLIDGPVMIRTLMRLSPMDDNYEHQLLMEFDRTSRAVVLASVASALVQGILATLGFWLADFDQIVLLLFLTSVMALVPFLGAASVWVPCALWLGLVEERWIAASMLALYGATIVSSIDNVIKVYVLHGRSQLHPLFALLSVIGGVSVFGPIGILVGPMVVVFLQTLLEILNHELKTSHEDEKPPITSAG